MGNIYRKSEHREGSSMTAADRLEIARFGFAYDDDFHRAVALFLRDLAHLDAEQQAMISVYELSGEYQLHPGFYDSAMLGKWPDRISIYDAFLEEKVHVNAMCRLMGRPELFRTEGTVRPNGFGILLRPTNKELRDFTLLLNTLLVDDLSIEFFRPDIPVAEVLTGADGRKTTRPIGTITLLQRWLAPPRFRSEETDVLADMFRKLRNLRDARAKPAHTVEDNTFDQRYIHEQRELIMDAFFVVRTLRMIFENHPAVSGYAVPDYLRNSLVWTR